MMDLQLALATTVWESMDSRLTFGSGIHVDFIMLQMMYTSSPWQWAFKQDTIPYNSAKCLGMVKGT